MFKVPSKPARKTEIPAWNGNRGEGIVWNRDFFPGSLLVHSRSFKYNLMNSEKNTAYTGVHILFINLPTIYFLLMYFFGPCVSKLSPPTRASSPVSTRTFILVLYERVNNRLSSLSRLSTRSRFVSTLSQFKSKSLTYDTKRKKPQKSKNVERKRKSKAEQKKRYYGRDVNRYRFACVYQVHSK